jgi:integrase
MSVRVDNEGNRPGWVADLRRFGGKPVRFATKAEAEACHIAAAEEFRITGSYLVRKDTPTFSIVAEKFIHHQNTVRLAGGRVGKKEIGNKKKAIQHLNSQPHEDGVLLGATRMADIRMGAVQNTLVPALFAQRANKTNRNIYAVFGQVIKYALVNGYLAHDPLMINPANGKTGIELPLEEEDEKVDPIGQRISKRIISKIISNAQTLNKNDNSWARLLVSTAAYTGLRAGEQAALTWDHFNFDDRIINVRRARKADGSIGSTKTKAGIRRLEIPADLCEKLQEWREWQPMAQRGANLIFPTASGNMQPDNSNWRNRILHPACERAGVSRIRWHDMRHFYASLLIYDLKESEVMVSAALGHKDAAFTRKQYGHWLDDVAPTTGMGKRLQNVMNDIA